MIGAYVLAMRLDGGESIAVGGLGEIEFPPGWYLYVGSALGPGGIQARVARHRRRLGAAKRVRWHVDYLRDRTVWGGAWAHATEKRLECSWSAALRRLPGAQVVARGFGASDCTCPAHLVRVSDLPGDDWFASALGAQRMTVKDDELDELLRTLASGNDEDRESAALALGCLGADAREPLAVMLLEGDTDARWWAARALAEVGGDGAVSSLIGALADADADMRACAALALGRIGDEAAVPALAILLTDESAFVASIAADALSMVGEAAAEVLLEMLADENTHARLMAVRALGRIGAQRAIGPLFSALEDPSYLVRYYAQEALEALGAGMVFVVP